MPPVAYLHPALERENLTAVPFAQVLHLTFDGKRCSGALYKKDGEEHNATANKEVIVCAGAVQFPTNFSCFRVLGRKEVLEQHGINVVADLPGVGQNLQDHLMAPVAYYATQPITLAGAASEEQAVKFQTEGKGMLTSNIGEAGGFLKLKGKRTAAPELQFHFAPGFFILHGAGNPEGHGFTLLPGIVGTQSKGNLTLRSADPNDPPIIDPHYLEEKADLDVIVEGVKICP